MGWIKRNLLFVISGVIALSLLGVAGYFIYQGWSRNSDASGQLNDIYAKLQDLNQSPLQPGNDKIDNIQLAKDQEQQLHAWIKQADGQFQPIPPIPQGEVNSKTYATALGSTIYELQQEAKADSVGVPNQYYFSFQVQSSKLTISSGLDPLAQQLGEVKAIVEILFAARVNDLDSIQRVRVSGDDFAEGLQSDYIDERPITNAEAIITPYVVTFRSFTPELAKVIAAFSTATNPFIIKSVSVQPASMNVSSDGMGAQNSSYGSRGMPGEMPPDQQSPGNGPMPGRGGLQTVLKEQLLRITMEVEIVKLQPK